MVDREGDCYEPFRPVMNDAAIRVATSTERPYDLACELAGSLLDLSAELLDRGRPNGLAVDAYLLWSALTDGIDGPPRYARGVTAGEVEELMRLAAKEWLRIDGSPNAVRTYLARWEDWPDSVLDAIA